ncbi:cilia- and flagella-associated protein 206-like [Microplitis mediator]|uniref:cilia- and flagella-associated protein 206-like n=1 Tax=Microplitis mediator TaxID=375433 RepID=UPI00255768FD|nr:cilia- and flagella-associated protein 206-like [Microplitis mediator]
MMKMQLNFARYYLNKNEVIKKYRQRLEKKLCPLINEVCETSRVNTDRDIEKIYEKILIVITIMSGLGDSMTPAVLKEAAMALQSIYLPSEVTNFVTLPKKAKNKQLIELMSIVAGIRLFNKDCQRGGHGIDNLPNILQESLEKSCNSTLKLLEDLMSKIYRLTAAVENIANNYFDKKTKSGCSDDEKFSEIKLIIGTLVTCRQQEIYVRKVLSDLEEIKAEFKILMDTLEMRLHKLHDTVKFRTAIPIVQVYPQFIDLTSIWMKLQDEIILLDNINNFTEKLKLLSTDIIKIYDEIRLEKFTNNSEILSDAERLERSMGKLINECGDCLILYPNTSENFQEIQIEFQGFCAWTFVAGYGALIPGNPNIGIVKWRARYFAFSSDYAASQFGKDPNRYMYEALDFVRKNPEYIHLFNLHEDIEALNNKEKTTQEEYTFEMNKDQFVQTDTHILDSYIDPDYHHSLWEHRHKALKLENISKCMTKSTQTNVSYFKRSMSIQASLPKNTSSQTLKDNGSNTPQCQKFIYGLRAQKNQLPHIINYYH